MRSLEELINEEESALPWVMELASSIPGRCVVHPAGEGAARALLQSQVTTRSPMGAVVYHTGGISILNGWLRILGSGSTPIPRSLPDWNEGRSSGFLLVADDVFGGFFALDGGALGHQPGTICYFAPDTLAWESLGVGYSGFLSWACTDFRTFYDSFAFPGCQEAIPQMEADRCFFFYPPLWAQKGPVSHEGRSIPVEEAWGSQIDIAAQMADAGDLFSNDPGS